MLRILFVLGVGLLAYLLLSEQRRERLSEQLKDASDVALSWLLRSTAQFGSELTEEGWEEQRRWREQRLRDLRSRRGEVRREVAT